MRLAVGLGKKRGKNRAKKGDRLTLGFEPRTCSQFVLVVALDSTAVKLWPFSRPFALMITVRVVPHSLPESPYSLPDSLLSSIHTLSSTYINNGHMCTIYNPNLKTPYVHIFKYHKRTVLTFISRPGLQTKVS